MTEKFTWADEHGFGAVFYGELRVLNVTHAHEAEILSKYLNSGMIKLNIDAALNRLLEIEKSKVQS